MSDRMSEWVFHGSRDRQGRWRLRRSWLCVSLICGLIGMVPARPLRAELVGTATLMGIDATSARAELEALLARSDVQRELERFGVSGAEARARIDALGDAEVAELQGRVAVLPAGGDFIGAVVGLLIVTLAILVVTDLLGFTDVFTFINPLPRGRAKTSFSTTAVPPGPATSRR